MKAALLVTLALALFASTASAQEETSTDSLAYGQEEDTEAARTMPARSCTKNEFSLAMNHCQDHHAPGWMSCHLTSCVVRNGWIVYSWDGYWVSGA
jgi:hypothetical protein